MTSNPFKSPRKTEKKKDETPVMALDVSSTSQSSEMSTVSSETDRPALEDVVREEVQEWLAIHGSKLFALETSKYLATAHKRQSLTTARK